MALDVQDLRTLDVAQVGQVQALLAQQLLEAFPQLDFTRGVLHDVVLHTDAALITAERVNIDTLRRSSSLQAIEADPALADDTTVDLVLSNLRITRGQGQAASGPVTILLDALVPVVIPAGASFTAGVVGFTAPAAHSVRLSNLQVSSTDDRALRPLGDGRYAFTIPVTAVDVGSGGMLRRGDSVTPGFPIPHFAAAYAESDFQGGVELETNAQLLDRALQGIAARTFSNRVTIDALVHATPPFDRTLQISTIGFGDTEMLRDRHTIFPLSIGGRADVYCRTAALPAAITLSRTATLLEKTADGGIWQVLIGRDDAPGFYTVDRIALPSASPQSAGYTVTTDARAFDISGSGWRPDIVDPIEAVYSRYQTAAIRFLDPDTPTALLTTGSATNTYDVTLKVMPLLAELQDFLSGRGIRAYGGDVLVKAPVPCFLSVGFTVRKRPAAADPDIATLQAAVANLVNNLGFIGQLHASILADRIHDYLADGEALSRIEIFGRIRRPDGVIRFVRDPLGVVAAIPTDAASQSTPRTVVFYLDPADVTINVEAADFPEI